MQLKMYNINKDRVVKGEIEIGRSKGSSVVGLAGHDQEWRVGVEVHGRGAWCGRGCIDCVRLVRREEIRRDRVRERGRLRSEM